MNLWSQQNVPNTHFFRRINLSYRKIFWITLFLFLCVVTFFLLSLSGSSIAQEGTSVSGRLIDTVGNAISDVTMYIRSYKGPNYENSQGPDDSVRTKTDSKGRFAFSDIHHKALKFDIQGSSKTGFEITVLSVEFGEIALYPFRGRNWSPVNFALDPGTKMENVIITANIRKRPKIRTRVVYANGTPLASTKIYAYRETKPFVGNGKAYGQLIEETNAEGYFVEYFSAIDQPQFYITLAVEHQGLYAKATPFILEEQVDLVLMLNGNPGSQTKPILEHSERFSALKVYLEPPPVWVVNPENGHAYKRTRTQTIKNAIAQASTEGAYLVAINDEAEEKWLSQVFGNERFWIGLSDVEEEGKWKWHSGEPVNYTNWGTYDQEGGNSDAKDYVMTGHFDWGWKTYEDSYEAGSPQNRSPYFGRTILEKVTIPLKN